MAPIQARRVFEPIVWQLGRRDSTNPQLIEHRHDPIVAIANTSEPIATGAIVPPSPCKDKVLSTESSEAVATGRKSVSPEGLK